MTKKFPSKISYGLLAFVSLISLGPLIAIWFEGPFDAKMGWVSLSFILPFAFVLHLFLNTHYTIDKDALKINCGFIQFRPIKVEDIKEISKTGSIISSPAPSFDRIAITYGKFGEIIISPKDKYGFASALTLLNPNIKNNLINT